MMHDSESGYELVFGLTADPIHLGHEQVITDSIEYLQNQGCNLIRFLLIPVYSPNLIAGKQAPQTAFKHRISMCEIIAKRLSCKYKISIEVSDIEKKLADKTRQPNYSINTIKALNLQNSLFVISADHFSGRWPKFRKWHEWRKLINNTGLLIHQRPGSTINESFIMELKMMNPDIFTLTSKQSVDTSSTYIRSHFTECDMSPHLSQDIIQFIKTEFLYQ